MPSAPPEPMTHFPPTSSMQPPPAFQGQNVQPGLPTQWTWQPVPVGNQVPHGSPRFHPGQSVPPFAAVACLFPCVIFGQVAEIVDNGSTSCATGALSYGGIQFLIGCACLISCAYRTRLRSKFNLIESPAPDWLTHFLCECCALRTSTENSTTEDMTLQ
ncbi:hypothetical protein MLD38_013126 [Melastoma candidum]|uniref:Uncharacterized protein n=1 Tax=Melastoma candidum TaxID=119954 RepID=A0ACB9RBP2_9MYRT|nr:hypothetical protein MLD38_013126 [Melastoma candidum]